VSDSPGLPVEQGCFWLATRAGRRIESLEGTVECDVAILGAGYTGLWTALFLKELEPGLDVAIVERETAGYGGSGRNAGIVGETLDHSHDLAIAHFGLEEARALARLGRENLDEMERDLSERGIDAGFERTGQLIVALADAHLAALGKTLESAERVGAAGWRLLDAGEARSEIDSPLYRGALLAPRNALVHPIRLVDGLRNEAIRLGIRVFEKTGVTGFTGRGERVTVQTAGGRVRARRVVVSTNAYTHHLLPRLSARFIPLYDYVLVSDPLTDAQRAAIRWRNRRGVSDARTFFNYYRLTPDDRILWGTSEAVYYPGNRVDPSCDNSSRHYLGLRESFRRHFPRIAELRFPYAWGGPIASTTRLTPFFGATADRKMVYGLGYTGHGIGSTRIAGKILAHLALERRCALLELSMVRRKPLPYPPEPLRRFAVDAVTRSLRRVDAGGRPGPLLRMLDLLGIGFSS